MAIIEVSAGHHPASPGARYRGFSEHQEALLWASIIVRNIGPMAGLVPVGVLKEKIAWINSQKECHLAVEIHFNSARNTNGLNIGDGSETLYYPGSEKGHLAALGVQALLSPICDPDRGAREGWYRMNKASGPDYFLSRTRVTSLIIEPEFIHRTEEVIPVREQACRAIAQALVEVVQDA